MNATGGGPANAPAGADEPPGQKLYDVLSVHTYTIISDKV
jgi:hypothetical protein